MENNEGAPVAPEATGGEGEAIAEDIRLSKAEYEELLASKAAIGSLKRELKDLKKTKESTETPEKTNKPEESALLEKFERVALKSAGLTHPDDIELARTTAKKWGMDIDQVVDDEDFKIKLERQQTSRANAEATSNIRGDKGRFQAKDSPEYWIAKGIPPTPDQVPNRKARAAIARAMMSSAKTSKTFYND